MTPEELREEADVCEQDYAAGHPIDIGAPEFIRLARAHAAALEEVERLNAAWKAQQFHLEAEERESAHWQERAEKAEREVERLKVHAEAMANGKDSAEVYKAIAAYRAEFKEE